MKHEEIYHTCDRCGKRMEHGISDMRHAIYQIRSNKPIELESKVSEKIAYIREHTLKKLEDNLLFEMEIIVDCGIKKKSYDLCPECRKEFERFMRNESN